MTTEKSSKPYVGSCPFCDEPTEIIKVDISRKEEYCSNCDVLEGELIFGRKCKVKGVVEGINQGYTKGRKDEWEAKKVKMLSKEIHMAIWRGSGGIEKPRGVVKSVIDYIIKKAINEVDKNG